MKLSGVKIGDSVKYMEGASTYTERVVDVLEDGRVHVVSEGAGMKLWNAGCAVGKYITEDWKIIELIKK